MVKSQYNYKGGLHCPSSQGQNCYTTKSSPVRLARLYFSNTYFISRLAFTTLARLKPRRVKGGMSLWNGMWHGLLNDIILGNVIYAECLKEIIIKLFEKSVIFWRQSISKSSRFFNVAGSTTMTIKQATKDSLISHCRDKKIAFFSQPQRFYLPLSLGLHGSIDIAKVGHWRKDVLELEGHSSFCVNFCCKKCLNH